MTKQTIILSAIVALFLTTISLVYAQNKTTKISYDEQWKKVEGFQDKNLPESALKEVDKIIVQAKTDKNTVQLIKASQAKMVFTLQKEPDKAPELIAEFEAMIPSSADASEKALLQSMTAELYLMYYQSDSYAIGQRTEVVGYVPEKITEWTKNIFQTKICTLLTASLSDAGALQKAEIGNYKALLTEGKNDSGLQPTLFDLLANRRISVLKTLHQSSWSNKKAINSTDFLLPLNKFIATKLEASPSDSLENQIMQTTQLLLQFHLNDDNKKALIYNDLNRLEMGYALFNEYDNNAFEQYIASLQYLADNYSKTEFTAEVLLAQAQGYSNLYNQSEAFRADYLRRAYAICEKGIQLYPNYKNISALKNLNERIKQKKINAFNANEIKPKQNLEIRINYTNLEKIQLNVYRLNTTAQEYYRYLQNRSNSKQLFEKRTLAEQRTITVKPNTNFNSADTTIQIVAGDYGIYEFTLGEPSNNNDIALGNFTVTDFAYMTRQTEINSKSIYVTDRVSGKPLSGVSVKSMYAKWNRNNYQLTDNDIKTTDNTGLTKLKANDDYSNDVFFFEKGEDKYLCTSGYSYFYDIVVENDKTVKTNLFLDRSVYRPGQIVYFKGINYVSNKEMQSIEANKSVKVELLDVNGRVVGTKNLKTNNFGSFADSFVLPEGGLNGNYSIRADNGYINFLVEEYKRPTFEVAIEKPKNEVRFGENVTIKGTVTAYAGYKINDASVSYRVIRQSHYLWRWIMPLSTEEIVNGTTKTDANGNFELTFSPQKNNDKALKGQDQFYTYTILADVTDPKGETQQGSQTVSVGDKSLMIESAVASKIDKDKENSFGVAVKTLNDETVNAVVNYELYRLADSEKYEEGDDEAELHSSEMVANTPKTIKKELSGTFNSSEKLLLNLKKLASGSYKIVYTTKDNKSNEVKAESIFVLYGENDKRPPVKTYIWSLESSLDCAVGEKALVRFGTSAKDVSVLYEIMQGNKVFESKWIKLSDEIGKFEIPFIESYGDGVTVNFTFIKDEKLHTKSIELKRKIEEHKLTPKLTIFRDKLHPGETAEWTVTIPETADKKKEAELLIGMYDASLDAINPHSWSFSPAYKSVVSYTRNWESNAFNSSSDYVAFNIKSLAVSSISLSTLNWMELNFDRVRYDNISIRRAPQRLGNVKAVDQMLEESVAGIDIADLQEHKIIAEDNVVSFASLTVSKKEEQQSQQVQVRTNFNETAFFYPQLRTDEQGNVKFSFTAPESLTRWNVKMLAHTPDLFTGYAENQVITQKELMVQLNMPRFVRRSDKLVLSANITNLTDKAYEATVNFELINPDNNKPIALKNGQAKKVSLSANETKAVEWEITEFSAYELVICKIVATSNAFSDGEQHYLPVLPDQILLTESLPLTVRANQTRDFSFENLLKNGSSVQSQSLTVEFASNPSWYAVQALPTLAKPENDNAFDYFTAYYVNTLATHIANANPKLSATFDKWKKEGGSRDALLSNLEKNIELKNMLLEETPWVLSAQDETEQKKQIALLFDLNQQKQQNTQYWEKLLTLQRPSGAFSWFSGMSESRYVTQYILLNNARLNKMLSASQKTTDENMLKAIAYIDNEIARDYEQLKKYNKKYRTEMTISDMQWFYLHVRSEYKDVAVPSFAKEAVDYYTSQAKKYWQKATLYGKSATALIASRDNDSKLANSILLSLKENAVKSDDMGMYWSKNRAGYFWNERPIMVQTMMLEAFGAINKNTAELDEMKIWLLRQKQTQRWDSPLSTVDAIYALLNYGTDWLSADADVAISLGGKAIDTSAKEAGTGYVKQTISAKDIQPKMGSATVSLKGNTGFGWGAMYWQYYQDLSQVKQAGNALQVTKKLFVEKLQASGKTIVPIESAGIKKGDKVITRLVVTSDRDLEFVALKDLRAGCFEPLDQTSGYVWKEGTGYYRTTKDASTQFFFSFLPKGTYVFEYEVWANNAGEFTSGITSIQCQYAPEFVSHSGGERIVVK